MHIASDKTCLLSLHVHVHHIYYRFCKVQNVSKGTRLQRSLLSCNVFKYAQDLVYENKNFIPCILFIFLRKISLFPVASLLTRRYDSKDELIDSTACQFLNLTT